MAECLGCEAMTQNTATLHDGRVVCTTCPEWRMECEARHVLGLLALAERRAYLKLAEEKRGVPAVDELRAVMQTLWQKEKTRC